MLKIWTSCIYTYKGADGIDTTVKSAVTPVGKALKPIWDIVLGHKAKRISDAEYTEAYMKLLFDRWPSDKPKILELLKQDAEITLLCYCQKGKFCHRHIAADYLKRVADKRGIPCELMGER